MLSLYKILEVSPGASIEEITRAYRKLAMKWHPDRNNGSKYSEEKFKEIKDAYEVLSNPSYKYIPPVTKPAPQVKRAQTQVVDVVPDATAWITLEQVETGISRKLSKKTICSSCNGTGQLHGPHTRTIGQVFGRRSLSASEEDQKNNRCPSCVGTGEVTDFDCHFSIPVGVWDGVVIKLACLDRTGHPIFRTATKNIKVRIETHPKYSVRGNDLYVNHTVKESEGRETTLIGLNNKKIVVKIPEGASNGTTLRLTGVGLPDLQTGERGNIYVTLKII